jgi:hypothetical protein
MLTRRAHSVESRGARAGEGVGADRPVPPGSESEEAGARRGELSLMGRKAERRGVVGCFSFSFYSKFSIPFYFLFSLLNSNPTKPQIQI